MAASRQSSQHPLAVLDFVHLRVTRIIFYYVMISILYTYLFIYYYLFIYLYYILTWWRYMWNIFHTYGVTWWPPKFRRSRISGICQIYRSSGYMSSLYCHMLIMYLEYSIQSETWTWIFQEYARYISNKLWYISHTRWLVSQLVLKGKMKGKCPCCTATWLLGVIHFMTQKMIF